MGEKYSQIISLIRDLYRDYLKNPYDSRIKDKQPI